MTVWIFIILLVVAMSVSHCMRQNRSRPTPPIITGAPYVVTRTPPRTQAQQAQYLVDGLIVPAWMAQEQQQQMLAQQHHQQQQQQVQQNTRQQKEEEAQRFAKDSKMTALL
jgi:hypothetical protein